MATEVLALEAIGTVDQWTLTAGATKVIACQAPDDDDTTYITSGATANYVQRFTLVDPAVITADDTINKVTVRWRHQRASTPAGTGRSMLVTAGGTIFGAGVGTLVGWTDQSDDFTEKPGGGAWDLTSITNIQVGVQNTLARSIYCTTIEVTVDYTPAAGGVVIPVMMHNYRLRR